MLKSIYFCVIFSIANCFTQFNTNIPKLYYRYRTSSFCIKMQDKIDNKQFNIIDKDKSGLIDKKELKDFFNNDDYMKIADLNNDNFIDYPEFERLVNINKFGIQNGGNLYVRNAIKFGFLKKDSILSDGNAAILVGNKGFDPLNCATDIYTLKKYREAEIKHGRIAMLASIGWPIAELYHAVISKITNNQFLLSDNNKVPSLLNGGLEKINPVFFMAIIVFSATIECIFINKDYNNYFDDRILGDLGFDPLKLYVNKDPYTKRQLELKELNNGRLAMIAITYYAFNEFISNSAIINNTPFLFKSVL